MVGTSNSRLFRGLTGRNHGTGPDWNHRGFSRTWYSKEKDFQDGRLSPDSKEKRWDGGGSGRGHPDTYVDNKGHQRRRRLV